MLQKGTYIEVNYEVKPWEEAGEKEANLTRSLLLNKTYFPLWCKGKGESNSILIRLLLIQKQSFFVYKHIKLRLEPLNFKGRPQQYISCRGVLRNSSNISDEASCKIVKSVNYFHQNLDLRYLAGF